MSKICSRCRQEKELAEFNKNRALKDGLACECKACRATDYQRTAKNERERKKEAKEYEDFITSGVASAKNRKDAMDKAGINNGVLVPYNQNVTTYNDLMAMLGDIEKRRLKK